MRERRSARVLLLDGADRVLLLRFIIPRSDGLYEFWAAPGGAVEAGETDAEAAARELQEEVGLSVAPLGEPVHTALGEFEFEGHWNISTDVFFTARWNGMEPRLGGQSAGERTVLQEWQWWSAAEIEASDADIYPKGIARLLEELRIQTPAAQ